VEELAAAAVAETPPPRPNPWTGPSRLHPHGSQHGRAKLDEGKVAEARELRALGWTIADIAHSFGVHPSTMGYALRGHTWQ
jgi:hypothetical protein